MNDIDWGTVLTLAGLFAVGFGYLARQMNRLEDGLSKRIDRLDDSSSNRMDRLERKIDQLTERYITHLGITPDKNADGLAPSRFASIRAVPTQPMMRARACRRLTGGGQ